MKIHLQVDGSPTKVRESAREIADLGADGAFSFEGQHDVFFPLVVAAIGRFNNICAETGDITGAGHTDHA